MSDKPAVLFDASTGRYRLNRHWSPAFSGTNKRIDRDAAILDLYRRTQKVPGAIALQKMLQTGEDPAKYRNPDSGDDEWNLKRAEADYLNLQVQNRAAVAENLKVALEGDGEPGGASGILYDALKSRPGHGLMRTLDIISRPAYATSEAVDSMIRAGRGEDPEHEGWKPAGEGQEGYWVNEKSGETLYRPKWDDNSGGSPVEAFGEGFEGGWRGLQGKDKTSFGKVLRNNDILEGKPAAVVGFGADVAFDPATYLTLGTKNVVKKGGEQILDAGERAAARKAAADVAARELLDSGKVGTKAGIRLEKKAFKKALDEQLKLRGVVKKPAYEVVEDINSHLGEYSTERAIKDVVDNAKTNPLLTGGSKAKRAIADNARKMYDQKLAEQAGLDYDLAQDLAGEAIDPKARLLAQAKAVKNGSATEKRAAVKLAKEAAEDDAIRQVASEAMDERATRLALRESLQAEVRFMGQPIIKSRAVGKGIAKGSAAMRGTRVGGRLAKVFRTDAEIGEGLHRINRQAKNVGANEFVEESMDVAKTYSALKLTKKERQLVARAVETGDTKGFTEKMVEGVEYAKALHKKIFDMEVEAGALTEDDWAENYLYHVYRNPEFKRGIGSWVKPTRGGPQKFRTLDEAIAGNARPIDDIADILVHRLAKSHRIRATHNMFSSTAARFGINLSGKKLASQKLRKLVDEGLLVEASKLQGIGKYFEDGVYFDQDVASSLVKMEKVFSSDENIRRMGRMFDDVQARLKYFQTAPNPGFHIRNIMSDSFINFLDGVVNPHRYTQAFKLIKEGGDPKSVRIITQSGKAVNGEDILRLYEGMGLQAGFFHADAEIIPNAANKWIRGGESKIRKVSEIREDTMRMAHFIDALQKAPGKTVEDAAEIAAKKVKKYNFDYQDLTEIEKKLFRRAVPYYTFMRKNVPLMLESFLTRPGRMIVPTKAMNAMSAYLGNPQQDQPLPGMISAVPQWMSVMPSINVVPGGPDNDQVMIQPDMPYNQLEQLFGGFANGQGVDGHGQAGIYGIIKSLTDQSTSLVSAPIEQATQKDIATGQDQPAGLGDAMLNQIPVGKLIESLVKPGDKVDMPKLFLKSDRPDQPTYTVTINGRKVEIAENVANYITGMSARKVTPERMKSELRRRQDIIEALIQQMNAEAKDKAQAEWDEKHPELVKGN